MILREIGRLADLETVRVADDHSRDGADIDRFERMLATTRPNVARRWTGPPTSELNHQSITLMGLMA